VVAVLLLRSHRQPGVREQASGRNAEGPARFLKAADICAAEPERSARLLAERGFTGNAELATQALREIPYARWRHYDSADSLRFYALRLHEFGAIKTSPQKLIAQASDWRFIDQLKKEMKA
jgi:NitT/TauT family transport system substrate-binding protein